MSALPMLETRRFACSFCAACLGLYAASIVSAQTPPASQPQTPAPVQPQPAVQADAGAPNPIAIVPLDAENSGSAASVTGALEVTGGKAIIAASGTITAGSRTTDVVLPHRGILRVCAATTVKLAADTSVPAGETPGLLIAMDQGAVETSFAAGRNADILLTPDFRILIGGPGSSELKVRLGRDGDTCVDNSGPAAPYVVVTSLFDPGLYRVQPGQHVMFQHGSLREVVDQESEPCGCPPPPAPTDTAKNEFPLAQSEGLAPTPAPAPAPRQPSSAAPSSAPPLVFSSSAGKPQPVALPAASAPTFAEASAGAPRDQKQKKKPGFFSRLGHFFRRLFGAD